MYTHFQQPFSKLTWGVSHFLLVLILSFVALGDKWHKFQGCMAFQSSNNSVKILKETQKKSRNNHPLVSSLAICRPNGCTVVSGIGVIVIGVCNRSQMRTSKCTCVIFGASIGLDPG